MNIIISEHPSDIRGLIRRRKLRIDPSFSGELKRLAADSTIRKSFFAAHGMRPDEAGEAMWDAGYLLRRPSLVEVLDILAQTLPAGVPPRERYGVPFRIAELMIDGKERTARQIRNALHIDLGRCICRDIRRLRGKAYGRLEMPVAKRGAKWFYRFTAGDIAKARSFVRPPPPIGRR